MHFAQILSGCTQFFHGLVFAWGVMSLIQGGQALLGCWQSIYKILARMPPEKLGAAAQLVRSPAWSLQCIQNSFLFMIFNNAHNNNATPGCLNYIEKIVLRDHDYICIISLDYIKLPMCSSQFYSKDYREVLAIASSLTQGINQYMLSKRVVPICWFVGIRSSLRLSPELPEFL